MKKKTLKLYIDQNGNIFYAKTLQELKEQIPGKVSIMYVDSNDGNVYKIGYVIGQHCLTCYEPQRVKVIL